MITKYETDVVAWANEQASLIRAGRFDLLDLKHIAEEIEDVGKSEQRELASLAPLSTDAEWIDDIWIDAKALTEKETGIDQGTLPEVCPWAMTDALTEAWLPA